MSQHSREISVVRIIPHHCGWLLKLCLIHGVLGVCGGWVRHGLFLGESRRRGLGVWFLGVLKLPSCSSIQDLGMLRFGKETWEDPHTKI